VRGGGHQNALASFRGRREEHIVDLDLGLVEDGVFAPPGGDGELGAHTGFVHHHVGVQPGGIDDPAAAEVAAVGLDRTMRPSQSQNPRKAVLSRTVAPFCTAFSAAATVAMKGSQMPPVGAHSAPLTLGLMFGSRERISSPEMRCMPGTPLFVSPARAAIEHGKFLARQWRPRNRRAGRKRNPARQRAGPTWRCPAHSSLLSACRAWGS
jgi:hypothetical protein